MKYLKLFERFIQDIKFYRFNHFDLLGENDSIKYSPKERRMIGPEKVNNLLVKLGFPDKNKCIHFMDSIAFDPNFRSLYGDFIYEIEVDDKSKIGWSFFIPINDWFYKGFSLNKQRNNPALQDLLKSEYKDLNYSYDDEDGDLGLMAEVLIKYGVIGNGNIEDLKKSKFFGNQSLFVWTNDDVIIKKYDKSNTSK